MMRASGFPCAFVFALLTILYFKVLCLARRYHSWWNYSRIDKGSTLVRKNRKAAEAIE